MKCSKGDAEHSEAEQFCSDCEAKPVSAAALLDDEGEQFTYDELGNGENVNDRDGGEVVYGLKNVPYP